MNTKLNRKSVVASAVAALMPVMAHAAMVNTAKRDEDASTNASTLEALLAMRSALSGSEYVSACVDVWGTVGVHHSKDEYRAGDLRPVLEAELASQVAMPAKLSKKAREAFEAERDAVVKAGMDGIKNHLSRARNLASWLADPVNFAKATTADEDGNCPALVTLDKLRKGPAKTRAPKTPDGSEAGEAVTATADSVIKAAVAQFGHGAVCNALADALNETKGAKFTADNLRALAKVA
jgi:hypothetical protein